MTAEANKEHNFWHLREYDEEFWANYLAFRPKYNANDFYNTVFSYHDSHSACYDVAHDIGTGPGQVAAVLASRFSRVVASDTNESHLLAAKRRCEAHANIELLLSPGEKVASKVPASSCDAVFCAGTIPLMDKERALAAFAEILKPNGTLAVWFYGRPFFVDGDTEACQAAYTNVFNKIVEKLLQTSTPEFRRGWKHGLDTIASRLDDVAFPADTWKHIERRKWNKHAVMGFNDENAMLGLGIDIISNVDQEREKVVEIEDDGFWAENWDVDQIRNFIRAVILSDIAAIEEEPEIQELFDKLTDAMGGKGTKRAIGWPVVLLLASKK
ncbi:hypothetical protein QQS21_005664 [Conoideocrella luteorostrata]|uniref:Methyltransferase type 11 domain-containing protein n=1 Tax=Conoideocrella luteorostrata TaxID=1105319 RepID=A0AAJ0CNZ7_9HYPO|nr:hypothetical protein QQS21_005664 [Conoideocrella luteorostrata]